MRTPKYRLHKGSGQAVVEIAGKRKYLGVYGSPESKALYDALVADWLANGRNRVANRVVLQAQPQAHSTTIAQLCDAFNDHAETYYRNADGSITSEPDNVRQAVKDLRRLYGKTPADSFTPKDFKRVRQAMIDRGLARTHINRQCARIKLVFRWAASEDLVNPSVAHGLACVSGLKRGRCEATESNPVKPVDPKHVEAIMPHCSKQVQAMLRLQLLTAMRPGEVVAMRACDLNTSGKIWTYTPQQHKTQHHGHERRVYLGPQSQRIIKPFMRRKTDAPLFAPSRYRKCACATTSVALPGALCCTSRIPVAMKRTPHCSLATPTSTPGSAATTRLSRLC